MTLTDKQKLEAHFTEMRKRQNDQFEVTKDGCFQCRHKVTHQSMQAWDVSHTIASQRGGL